MDELECVKNEQRALQFAWKGSTMQQHMHWATLAFCPRSAARSRFLACSAIDITDVQGRPSTVHYDLCSLMGEDEDHVGAQRRTSTGGNFVRCTWVTGPAVVP